jgi:hypothetical protein
MRSEQLFVTFICVIGIYLILSSLDEGLNSIASKKTGSFVNGTQIWSKVMFGIISGAGLIYFASTSLVSTNGGNNYSRNIR